MHEIGIEWMTQTEVNGHFLELRGIPDEKLEWERIPEAIAGGTGFRKNIFKNSVCHRRRYQRDDNNGCTGTVSGRRNGENLSMGGISESDRKDHRKSMAAAGGRKDRLFCGR